MPDDFAALLQPSGGYLLAEECVAAHIGLARQSGADIRTDEDVIGWESSHNRVTVRTTRSQYSAGTLVLAAGSWTGALLPSFAELLVPERQVVAWFDMRRPDLFVPERFPVFNIAAPEGRFYGFPSSHRAGFKIGKYHHLEQHVDATTVDQTVHERDLAVLRDCTRRYFPDVDESARSSSVCLFTNTPDEHFVIGRLADQQQVIQLSPCSGHGFKFASVVGEIVADLVTHGATSADLSLFTTDRFHGAASAGAPSDVTFRRKLVSDEVDGAQPPPAPDGERNTRPEINP